VSATSAKGRRLVRRVGMVYALSAGGFTGKLGPTVILVIVADTGLANAVPEGEIRQILTTLRPEK